MNTLAVTPSELVAFLVQAITARMPVLVTGDPGIGKSDLMNLATRQTDADLIVTHPAIEDPTVPAGLPFMVDGVAEFLPYGQLRRARAAKKLTVWFADDFGQATPATQAAYMPLLDAVRGHNTLLGEGAQHIVFVAATNHRTNRAGVSGILEPVKSRFATILELKPDLNDSCSYAIAQNYPAELIAFWRLRPDLLSDFKPSADMTNSPSPRTWSHVAKLLALALPNGLQHKAIAGAVGEGAAVEFSGFLRMWRELTSIDAILIDPTGAKIPDSPAALYAVTTALATRATSTNIDRIGTFADRLATDGHGEFAVLLVRDCLKRQPLLAHTPALINLFTGQIGRLMNGEL